MVEMLLRGSARPDDHMEVILRLTPETLSYRAEAGILW